MPTARPGAGLAAGIWRLSDPKMALAALAAIVLGTAAAAHDGTLAPAWFALTVLGISALEVGKNASGEVFDFDSGADRNVAPEDRSPFSGGRRVLLERRLTRGQVWAVAAAGYGIGIGVGLAVVLLRDRGVLWIGLAGVLLAYIYNAPPLKLAYRGLGEAAVALCYGPLIVAGAYLVQRGALPFRVVLLGLPLGLLITAFLWVNEFPDFAADTAAGKRNLVVRLGRPRAARWFAGLVCAAFAILALLPLSGLPVTVWLGVIAAVPTASAAEIVLRQPTRTAQIVQAQARTLFAFVLFAAATAAGLLLPG